MIKTIEDFEKVKLGSKIYKVQPMKPVSYYYAGLQPNNTCFCSKPVVNCQCGAYIMLISGGDVRNMSGVYIPKEGVSEIYVTSYDEAVELSFKEGLRKLISFDKIYLDGKKGMREIIEKNFPEVLVK